jgi:hypothetical protein
MFSTCAETQKEICEWDTQAAADDKLIFQTVGVAHNEQPRE